MKKDIEWLKQWIEEYESEVIKVIEKRKDEKDEVDGFITTLSRGKQSAIKRIKQKIDELDEPETLSEEWLDENKCSWMKLKTNGYYIPVEKLQNLLVTNKEKVIIPQFVAVYLDFAKSNTTLMRVLELANTRNEWEKWEKVYDWIEENHELFARAWLDGYTVEEEQRYFAKIKGHENISSDDKYWNYCITDETLDIGDNKVHPNVLAEYVLSATKDGWENLGINDDNADFVKVKELEE